MFNKELDKSLWFMLESDINNRDSIIDFLKSIPNDMIVEIKHKLGANIKENCEGKFFYPDGTIYFYFISYQDDESSLEIKQEFSDPGDDNTMYFNFGTELLLVSSNREIVEICDEFWLGDFTDYFTINNFNNSLAKDRFKPFINSYNYNEENNSYLTEIENEYYLEVSNSKYRIRKISTKNGLEYLMFNSNDIPTELSLNYINDRYSLNDIKKRKREK